MYDILGVEPHGVGGRFELELWIPHFCYWGAFWRWRRRLLLFFFDTSGELIPISTEVLIYLHTLCDSKCSTVYEFNLLSISERASLVYRVY